MKFYFINFDDAIPWRQGSAVIYTTKEDARLALKLMDSLPNRLKIYELSTLDNFLTEGYKIKEVTDNG